MATRKEPEAASPIVLPAAERAKIFAYFGGLTVLLAFADPTGGLLETPISFFLKNRLHLSAHEVAVFRALAAAPLYVSFLFGLARDRWNPLGMGDRGFMFLYSAIGAILYLAFAFAPPNYVTLLAALVALNACSLFVGAAQNGLASTLGQQHAMTGQMSAIWSIFGSLPVIAALIAGGAFSGWLEQHDIATATRLLFFVGAGVTALAAFYALLKPRAVFGALRPEPAASVRLLDDLRRLARHRPVYPAFAIWLLWNFAPGSTTSLQFYLQNTLHAPDAQWGVWNAIFAASFIPTFLLYGYLCQRVSLDRLLWWGTLVAVPQFIPLLFVHSLTGALVAAAPMGLLGGVATAAYLDLLIRSCPPGLQGTTMMLSGGLYSISARFGDILGTRLYDGFGGFTICVVVITIAYALILPVLRAIPHEIVAHADNEVVAGQDGRRDD